MSRMPRKLSSSGYYHVVCRGIGKQVLFEENEDYERYLKTLKRFLAENSISLIAYCLMENHVHLLLHAENGLNLVMKQISVSYSYYFNNKYDRTGHLFQDRFMSKPIENEHHLLATVRYIHNNPPKAGICPREKYHWSSWKAYTENSGLVDTELVLKLSGGLEQFIKFSKVDEQEQFNQFSKVDEQEQFLDIPEKKRLSDKQAIEVIHSELQLASGTQLQSLPKAERDESLRILKNRGLSVRQIERLTGINRGAIQRA